MTDPWFSRPHHVYVVRGPSGVYVGMSRKPLGRWATHKWCARTGKPGPLYDAMRCDGESSYSFEIVAVALGWRMGLYLETTIMAQEVLAGARLFNVANAPDAATAKLITEIRWRPAA